MHLAVIVLLLNVVEHITSSVFLCFQHFKRNFKFFFFSYTKSLIAESIVAFVAYDTLSKGTASINVSSSGLCSNYANDLMLIHA